MGPNSLRPATLFRAGSWITPTGSLELSLRADSTTGGDGNYRPNRGPVIVYPQSLTAVKLLISLLHNELVMILNNKAVYTALVNIYSRVL